MIIPGQVLCCGESISAAPGFCQDVISHHGLLMRQRSAMSSPLPVEDACGCGRASSRAQRSAEPATDEPGGLRGLFGTGGGTAGASPRNLADIGHCRWHVHLSIEGARCTRGVQGTMWAPASWPLKGADTLCAGYTCGPRQAALFWEGILRLRHQPLTTMMGIYHSTDHDSSFVACHTSSGLM